ncbi:MAG: thiamine-phosphate kinase [Thiohalomonadaceae bacterium]
MALGEFQLIERFFTSQPVTRDDVTLGVGDDCALLRVPAGMLLAVTMDTLVEGRHFPQGTDPGALGHKALAVNLSDLAAMGAEPAWVTLSLSLPAADEGWLTGFADGLLTLAERHGVQLVGGDTVRGPLAITVQAHGFVPPAQALRRGGAGVGDTVYVTGTLGEAGAGLQIALGERAVAEPDASRLRMRLDRPSPRLEWGRALRGLASAAIDVSDGLAADLGHILEASGVGATLRLDALPVSEPLCRAVGTQEAHRLALAAGDDYELCFTAPVASAAAIAALPFPCTAIGTIEPAPGLRILDGHGNALNLASIGFDHFRGTP